MIDTFLSARWENLIMANYAVDPQVLKPYVPNGVALDLYDGLAYVSLVGFMFRNTRLFGVPVPFMGTFEEINLRFYVKRTGGANVKRGVVFINETVPYKIVAWLANKLYKEHYTAIPTRHQVSFDEFARKIRYEWKINERWNHLAVVALPEKLKMQPGSIEEFIFEHYYGYTKTDEINSLEYKVNHERWLVNAVKDYSIDCDFTAMYGGAFSFLNKATPSSVLVAEGSAVTVNWKRHKI